MCVEGDASELIKEAKCGVICKPQNSTDIANSIENLLSKSKSELKKMGLNGKDFYNQKLSIDIGISKFVRIFNE